MMNSNDPREHNVDVDQSPFENFDERYRLVFDAINDGVFLSNPATGRFIEVNQSGCRMFGYEKHELLGSNIEKISSGIPPYAQKEVIERSKLALSGQTQAFEWHCRTKSGHLFWAEVSVCMTQFGSVSAIVANVRDITERKQLHEQITYLAQYDSLTGLLNRPMFEAALERAAAQSRRNGQRFAILYIDLDRFKDVNDTQGHSIGDRVLELTAKRLQAVCRHNDTLARLGGDEFAMLLSDESDPVTIAALADRLVATIAEPFWVDDIEVHIGASVGAAIHGDEADDLELVLSQADIAMYRAKQEGRGDFRLYSESMGHELRESIKLKDDLREAIRDGQLFLVYQPQVMASSGRITGVEALVRWHHPQRGILNPDSFLPTAESSGLITALGEWVLREACHQARTWIDEGYRAGTMSVNLSPLQLNDPIAFENLVWETLQETQLPAHMLELEITETTFIAFTPDHLSVIQRLRAAGVKFALDDFGTGNSSLHYLQQVAVDRIKVAREITAGLPSNPKSRSILKFLLALGRDIHSKIIVEGVETPEQLAQLQGLRCPEAQGYLFARPMSAEEIAPLLKARTISPTCFERARECRATIDEQGSA